MLMLSKKSENPSLSHFVGTWRRFRRQSLGPSSMGIVKNAKFTTGKNMHVVVNDCHAQAKRAVRTFSHECYGSRGIIIITA